MFPVYPIRTSAHDIYSLASPHPRREVDAYGLQPDHYYPSGAARFYHQPTGPSAARKRYLSALEQAREAEREYLESLHGSSSSFPLSRPYDDHPYSPSYYDHDAIERERALAAALEEQRLLLLARQQEEERVRMLEERRRAAAVAEELRRAREAEERRRLEEIRAKNEQLKVSNSSFIFLVVLLTYTSSPCREKPLNFGDNVNNLSSLARAIRSRNVQACLVVL
jgi:hypothetical protein